MTGTDETLAGELEAALCAPTWAETLGHVHNAIAALSPPASEAVGEAVERVARAIAPLICAPVHNGDCDDVAAGQDFARRVARAALAAKPDQTALLREAHRVLMHHYREWDGEPEDVLDIREVAACIDQALADTRTSSEQGPDR